MTTLFIKNMVCNRCIMVVQSELEKLGLGIKKIKLGEVVLEKPLDSEQKHSIEQILIPLGFEVIDDKKSQIIEKIKTIIIDQVHHADNEHK